MQECLAHARLMIASEKIQQFPYQYLGHQLLQTGVKPQKVTLCLDKLQTLNDFPKLLRDLNRVWPSLGIPMGVLKLLFDIL